MGITAFTCPCWVVIVAVQLSAASARAEMGTAIPTNLPQVSVIKVGDVSANPSAHVSVPVFMNAIGREAGLTFSLSFDRQHLRLDQVEPGCCQPDMDHFLVNTQYAAEVGVVGVAFSLPADLSFPTGSIRIANLTFMTDSAEAAVATRISFADHPIAIELADSTAHVLDGIWLGGTVLIRRPGTNGLSCESACSRGLRLAERMGAPENRVVGIRLSARGDETVINCSIGFDPTKAQFIDGAGSVPDSVGRLYLYLDTISQGRLGLFLEATGGGVLPAGDLDLGWISIRPLTNLPGALGVGFTDEPVPRLTLDRQGNLLSTEYLGTVINIPWAPALLPVYEHGALTIIWPERGTDGFVLECAPRLFQGEWKILGIVPQTNMGIKSVVLPPTNPETFFRLRKP